MGNLYGVALKCESRQSETGIEVPTVPQGIVANPTEASELAKKCLRQKTVKEWSSILNLNERSIQRWISGELKIPPVYHSSIIVSVKGYFMEMSGLEKAIDYYLLMNFGRKQ